MLARRVLSAVCGGVVWIPAALGQGVITDGNARFEFNDSATLGSADLQPDSQIDHAFQNWWFVRVDGAGREVPLAWRAGSQSYVGDTAVLSASGPGGLLWTLRVRIEDGTEAGVATLYQELAISNPSARDREVAVFSYLDLDVGGTAGSDRAVLESAGMMRVFDGVTQDYALYSGVGSDAYRADTFPLILTQGLDDADVDNLENTGLPFGPGDFTGAFQWDRRIGIGETVRFEQVVRINNVPGPGAAGMVVAAGGVMAGRRRRR